MADIQHRQQASRIPAINTAKLGGFAAGIALTLVMGLVGTVGFTGKGIGDAHVPPAQVYVDF